ncbi:Ubiquitin carboxyl-terminal hydrolase 42, partial [Spheniscus humboldti]
ISEGTAPPQRVLFPPGKICIALQQTSSVGAGLYNVGDTCFLNSVLRCLTYTPPLANYLLSQEHSQSCDCQQGFCLMCRMEKHSNKVLHFSASAMQPRAAINVPTNKPFQVLLNEDAHKFLRCTVDAMQRACLIDSKTSAANTRELGGGWEVEWTVEAGPSCQLLGSVWVRVLPRAQCSPFSLLQAASSVTATLEDFMKPEQLDGKNYFKCSKCDKMVATSKRFTIHHVLKVLTACLKRFEDFTGGKISVVEYPEYLDLQPYTSQTAGEPLLYALYAVLVHSGDGCYAGHYFCCTKASNGLWYEMSDASLDAHGIDTVLRQQAYSLFYVR